MGKLDRLGWYDFVADKINGSLEQFYNQMYQGIKTVPVGGGFWLEPCPMCGHNDCAIISDRNSVHCFSGGCGWKGTHIKAYIQYAREKLHKKQTDIIRDLERWSGIPYPLLGTKEEVEAAEHYIRIQDIRSKASEFYHNKLMTSDELYKVTVKDTVRRFNPLQYQMEIRKHKRETLSLFRVMFSADYLMLHGILETQGYTAEEIKEAKVWFPQNTFVYPYFHPVTGDILRFNVKNPFGATMLNSDKEVVGYSVGAKVLGFSPKFSYDKPMILVEGENDALSVFEAGFENVVWVGGNIREEGENQLDGLEKANGPFYTAYDNDDAGRKYYKMTQERFPHKDVRRLDFGEADNDIDDYYRYNTDSKPIFDLVKAAEFVPTQDYRISRSGVNNWSIRNRHRILNFEITDRDKNDEVIGKVDYYVVDEYGEASIDEKLSNQVLIKCKTKMKPFHYYLHEEIEKFFNEELDKRTADELMEIYSFSTHKTMIIKLLAGYMSRAKGDDLNDLVDRLKRKFNKDIVDEILKELNDIQNDAVLGHLQYIPKMKVSQHYNARNGDAYIYFTREMRDGDVVRRIPYLLRNDGLEIRLDLLKRKDEQCLLLIDNKYELRDEISKPMLDSHECSLWQAAVDKWKAGEMAAADIDPGRLIQELESWIRRFYFFKDPLIYKLLSLYVYGTYFYELFNEYPYLFLNGEKGSGKSTLDTILYLLCFDAKHAINITEASLYRLIAVEGGTMILDEMENLTSRKAAQDSVMASVLKGGYAKAGLVYRYNTEKNVTESFCPYGPKIISNIFGLEDIIGDRCIEIKTYRLRPDDGVVLEDPKTYVSERMDIIRDLTSRCCLSALTHFKFLHSIFESKVNKIKTTSPRASQLINPLLAVSRFVDVFITGKVGELDLKFDEINGPYEKALTIYHDTVISTARKVADDSTPEGIVKFVVKQIAYELIDRVPHKDKQYTVVANHKYQDPIMYNEKEGWFEINAVHMKCFLEEHMPGENVYPRNVTKWISLVFNTEQPVRKMIQLKNQDLIDENNGNECPRVNFYRFFIDDLVEDVMVDEAITPIDKLSAADSIASMF